jgi:hypothetical protein
MSNQSPTANSQGQGPEEPFGDRGKGDKTWKPDEGEQGISNRIGDQDPEPKVDKGRKTDPLDWEKREGDFDEDETNPSPA